MTENPNDPAGNTHEFRAFMNRGQGQPAKSGPSTGVIVGIAVAALIVVVAIVAVLAL